MNFTRLQVGLVVTCALASMSPASAFASDWDAKFGGVRKGGLLTLEGGYSGAPRAAYEVGMSDSLSVGGAATLDFGYHSPDAAGSFGLLLQVPIRMRLMDSGKLTGSLTFQPGVGLFMSDPFRFGILAGAGANIGYAVSNTLTVGGGVDVPVAVIASPAFALILPILVGPVAELRINDALKITAEMKLGPWIGIVDGGSGTNLGFAINGGIAYAM